MSRTQKVVPIAGSMGPDFVLATPDGVEVALSSYRNRNCLVLVFLRGLW